MHRMIYHISYGSDRKAHKILPEEEARQMVKEHPNEWFISHVDAMSAHIVDLEQEKERLMSERKQKTKKQATQQAKKQG